MNSNMKSGSIVSIVLGTFNRLHFLKLTVNSIRRELELCGYDAEIIVIEGGSTDGTLNWLTKQKDIISIIQHNRGEWQGRQIERRSWGYFMNLGFKCAQGKYVCMLSDDCLVVPGSIKNGVELFEKKLAAGEKIGAVAFYWRNWPEEQNYRVGLTFGGKMFVNHGLYLREALKEVGYVDANTYSFYHADGDLCLRMAQCGYYCIDSMDSFIEHHSHANISVRSENLLLQQQDWQRYSERWQHMGRPKHDWLEKSYNDPHMSANQFKRRFFCL